jgi:hypothetical protein
MTGRRVIHLGLTERHDETGKLAAATWRAMDTSELLRRRHLAMAEEADILSLLAA